MVGELPAIVPEIEGEAHLTGEHTFSSRSARPLRARLPALSVSWCWVRKRRLAAC